MMTPEELREAQEAVAPARAERDAAYRRASEYFDREWNLADAAFAEASKVRDAAIIRARKVRDETWRIADEVCEAEERKVGLR